MRKITHWETGTYVTPSPYYTALREGRSATLTFAPPSLKQLDTVMDQRRAYINKTVDRDELCQALMISHQKRHAPSSSLSTIEQLRSNDCYMIITGQQPGLLTGPLFTLYKIIHAITLAKTLTESRCETFIPVFWNASEDHDIDEIASLQWITKEKKLFKFIWESEIKTRPLSAIPMDDCPIDELLISLQQTLHPTEFNDAVYGMIEECRDESVSYPDFIDQIIWRLFPDAGLLILRPEDEFMRQKSVPIIQREIENPLQASGEINQATEQLESAGLPPQIHKLPNRTSFFLVDQNVRKPLYASENHFTTADGATYTREDLVSRLHDNPEDFSPSAVLRPIVQDALLPTISAILGPGEMAYHFLLRDIYARHHVPRPCVTPRKGLTLLDPRELKRMEQLSLTPSTLKSDATALLKQWVSSQKLSELSEMRDSVEANLETLFDLFTDHANTLDPSIVKVLQKNHAKIIKGIEQSEDLLTRRAGDKNKQILSQIEALQISLFPDRSLQERGLTIIPYLLKYGPDFITSMMPIIEALNEGEHALIEIP